MAPVVEALEPRILFSADLFGGALDAPDANDPLADQLDAAVSLLEIPPQTQQTSQIDDTPEEPTPQTEQPDELVDSSTTAEPQHTELVLVDSATDNYQQLVDDLLDQTDESRRLEVVLLDSERSGIDQISETLLAYQNLDAIHLISHGSDGIINIGNTALNTELLNQSRVEITAWSEALNEQGDLLIYGCNLAATEAGQTFVDTLAQLTGADIAASDDLTGHATQGGDWDLEIQTGAIESTLAISQATQDDWQNTLAIYTVTNTDNSGIGSLRQAIINANINSGSDNIDFDISAALVDGAHTISLTTPLDDIIETVTIDGTTDSDFTDKPIIVLDGSGAGASVNGLTLTGTASGDSTIRGLVIHSFSSDGIELTSGSDNNTIVGNYIGTDVTGTIDMGNTTGIRLALGSDSNTIGGATEADRNVISGNYRGIFVRDSDSNVITGNYIGTDFTGTLALGNGLLGIEFDSDGSDDNTIGGTAAGEGNIIAFNASAGVASTNSGAIGNSILGNLIHSNGTGLGIDLGDDGVTANDADDGDSGANNLQNFPVITAAATAGSQIEISGTLDTNGLNQAYRIEFFATGTPDGTGYGEAERYLGHTTITTDGSGDATFTATIEALVYADEEITATATVDNGNGTYGDTSEFSANFTATTATNEAPTFMPLSADGIVTTPIGSGDDGGNSTYVQ
ncbi:MAG: DUF4347 domain-containing protein, partial [Gammaproteobacteria bacterium]|nr:DUF4347 domain-containing protein [Gammaproteobacteria bacterium]